MSDSESDILKDFLSIEEAAQFAGISHWTVRKYIADAKLTKYKRQSRIVVNRTELLALIEPHEIVPAEMSCPAKGRSVLTAPLPEKETK